MKKRRVLIPLIAVPVLSAGFLLTGGLRRSNAAPEFQFAEIERGNLEIVVSSTGTLNALKTVKVGAGVSGTLQRVYVDYNDTVKKGDLLALIDPTAFEAAVKEARASVANAEAALEKAKAEYDRNEKLYKKGYISEFDFLSLKTSLKTAEAGLLSAEAKLTQVEANLENTKIRSPISGTVIERSVDEGQTIASSFQAPELFIIAEDLKKMQIEADVDENDIGQIKKGQKVRFTVQAYPDHTFTGTVRQVRLQPETVQNVVNYTVVVDVSNKEGLLLPGMTATIDFIILDHRDVLLVPNSVLSFYPPVPEAPFNEGWKLANIVPRVREDGKPAPPPLREVPEGRARVFCLGDDGHPRGVLFTPGESDGVFTEVLEASDLQEGMKVITGVISQGKKKASVGKNFLLPGPGGPPPGRL